MSDAGVFAVDRSIFDHPFFEKEPFTQREAWLWLLSEAAWKSHRRRVGKILVDLKRGQVAASYRFLAERWQWSLGKVQRFMTRLKTDTMVETQTDTGLLVITICNYNKYQRVSRPTDTQADTTLDTEAIQDRYKLEDKGKQEKDSIPCPSEPIAAELPLSLGEEGKSSVPKKRKAKATGHGDPFFPAFWDAWPKRAECTRKVAFEGFHKAVRNHNADPAALVEAARAYARAEGGNAFRHGVRAWFRDGHWERYLPKAPVLPQVTNTPPAGGWTLPVSEDRAFRFWSGNSWPASWGPQPGYPGCRVPDDIQSEWTNRRAREAGQRASAQVAA